MLWRRRKTNCLDHLLRVYAKRNISQRDYNFLLNEEEQLNLSYTEEEAIILLEHIQVVKIEEFLAWFIACPKFITFDVSRFLHLLYLQSDNFSFDGIPTRNYIIVSSCV
jgi:hypothetical protein